MEQIERVMDIKEIYSNLPKLETKRLILRRMLPDDAQNLFEYASNPEIPKYLSWEAHKSIDDSLRYLKLMLQRYENAEVSEWGIIFKENNKFIGTAGFLGWITSSNRAEIAFALSQEYWNRGIMTEVIKEIITFGFEKMELNRIEARCFTENIASERVMIKSGMSFEGVLREQMLAKSRYNDLKLYSILRKEFYSQKL